MSCELVILESLAISSSEHLPAQAMAPHASMGLTGMEAPSMAYFKCFDNTDKAILQLQAEQQKIISLADEIANLSRNFGSNVVGPDIRSKIQRLLALVETPTQTVQRLIYQPQQNAVLKTCVDLGIFRLLESASKNGQLLTAASLCASTGADRALMVRLMRVLVASHLCDQLDIETYAANEKTSAFAAPIGHYGTKCLSDLAGPTASKLPEFLQATGYRNPESYDRSPMQWTVGMSQFEWIKAMPERDAIFSGYMRSRRAGMPAWFEKFPAEATILRTYHPKTDSKLVIDVGGNKGHDLAAFLKAFPDARQRLVLEDLPSVLPSNCPGVILQPYDFFEAQPIKGAKAYLFRSIFHDWSDEESRKILKNTVLAMVPGYSKIVICDFVLPDISANLFPSLLDIQMMSLSSGLERSERQWRSLLSSVGLKITNIWKGEFDSEAVIEAMLSL